MGHTISNMTLSYEGLNSEYNELGFFTKNYGKIYDLNVECDIDAEVIGKGNLLFAGAISGFSYGEIQNCNANGAIDISSDNDGVTVRIGGLIGQSGKGGDIYSCSNKTTINLSRTANTVCGGIVGYYDPDNQPQRLEKCANSGNISIIDGGDSAIGGIVGGVTRVPNDIKNLYNIGEITMTNCEVTGVGGIVGSLNVDISNIYNRGNITVNTENTSNGWIGGIIGISNSSQIKISNGYNAGTIDLTLAAEALDCSIAGVCGINSGTINNCYNSGQINNINSVDYVRLGAIAGRNNGIIKEAYYNNTILEVSGTTVGTIDNAGRKDNLPTILEVINGDNVFENDGSGYPVFKK